MVRRLTSNLRHWRVLLAATEMMNRRLPTAVADTSLQGQGGGLGWAGDESNAMA